MLKQVVRLMLTGIIVLWIGVLGYTEEWSIYGPRAQGMGGAGIAVVDGATASYWNPASMTLNDKSGIYIPFGTTVSAEGNILKYVSSVFDSSQTSDWLSASTKISNGQKLSLDETRAALDLFVNKIPKMDEPGQGVLGNINTGATFTFGNIGVFANFLTYAGIDPTVSLNENMSFNTAGGAAGVFNMVGNGNDRSAQFTNPSSQGLADSIAAVFASAGTAAPQNQAEELVYQSELAGIDVSNPALSNLIMTIAQSTAGSTGAVTVNASGIIISGITVKEIGLSYGYPLIENKLSVGGNFKIMQGDTFYKFFRYDNMEEGSKLVDEITSKSHLKTSTTFGLDIGALYSLTDNLKVGLTGRNLNKPKFNWAGPGDYKLDPQLRSGVSLQLPLVLLAADYDLTKNKSLNLDGFKSQMFDLGTEINLIGVLKLRGGLYKNLAVKGSGSVYTLGTGLHFIALDIDVACAMSTDKVKIGGGDDIRERYSVGLSLALRF